MTGDGKKTNHWYRHVLSADNAKQVSTHVGGASIVLGGYLQTLPSVWAQLAGLALIAVGGTGVGHNANP